MAQKLGELLVTAGLLTDSQLKTALRTQEFFGGHLGSILIDLGFLDEQSLGETLSRAAGVRYAPPQFLEDVPEEVIKAVPAKVAERYKCIPLRVQEKRLHLAMLNPKDLVCLDEISYISGMVVVPYVAPEFRIYQALERYYNIAKLRPDRITMSGSVDPKQIVSDGAPRRPPSRPRPRPSTLPPNVGLDGLPLDAEVSPVAAPAAPAADRTPRTDEFLEQLPRSLSEWREAPQASQAPARAPVPGVIPPWDRTPISTWSPPPEDPGPAPVKPRKTASAKPEDPLEEPAQRLLAAETRDDIAEIVLNVTGKFFRRRLLFFYQRDRIVGWDGWGDQIDRERVRNVLLPLESLSLFTPFKSQAQPYRGPVADLPANRRLYEDLGMTAPPEVVLLPVVLKDRIISVIYGDNGTESVGSVDMEILRRITHQTALALEILILRNKLQNA